jgi:cytoskeletal protein CcmA (bactofilin family)
MFKKNAGFREGVDTLIGFNTTFTGNIVSEGSMRIDGKVKGDVKVTGDVYIGENSTITGNIECSNVHLSGTVEGNITAKGLLKILSTAKLYGDIRVNSFVADEGALFQGKCSMMEASSGDAVPEKSSSKKNYKKSNVLEEVYDDK